MPLPSTLNARNLAAIFDANEQSLGWVKDLTETPLSSSNTIPSEQLIALPLGKNEVVVCYGEKHPLHNEDSRNIAYFDALLQVSDFGTTLEYTGARPIEPPVSLSFYYSSKSADAVY